MVVYVCILAFQRLRQGDLQYEATLNYIEPKKQRTPYRVEFLWLHSSNPV
jgi:hypothetical protein